MREHISEKKKYCTREGQGQRVGEHKTTRRALGAVMRQNLQMGEETEGEEWARRSREKKRKGTAVDGTLSEVH